MTTPDPVDFDDLCGGLPDHHTEVMTAHQSSTVDNTPASGAGRGLTDEQKYSGGNA